MDGIRVLKKLVLPCQRMLVAPCTVLRTPWRVLHCLFAAGIFFSLAGCADLKGIQVFGKMAPDPAAIQGLTQVYAQQLDVEEDIKLLGDYPRNPEVLTADPVRAQQARAIQQVDSALRDYMQSLAALAGADVVQSSSNVKDVTTGLTSLSKSMPTLGLSSSEITVVGQFVQSIADLIESGYRNAKLVAIIHDHDADVQTLISVQSKIVSRGIRPSIEQIQMVLNQDAVAHALKFIDEDLNNWTVTPGANAPPANSVAANLFNSRNPAFKGQGEADAHAARYLLRKSVEADQSVLATQLATADAYTKALKAIGVAHQKLVANGKNVLTKDMLQQIQPLANEVHQDFEDIKAPAAAPAKH
jgi:hypothetical protein